MAEIPSLALYKEEGTQTSKYVTSQHCLLCDFLQYKQNTEMQYMNTAKCKMVTFLKRP